MSFTYLGDSITAATVRERIDELEAERSELEAAFTDEPDTDDGGDPDAREAELDEWDEDNHAELAALRKFYEEIPSDETLIADDKFEDYARDLAEDLHGSNACDSWPFTCIDWKEAADALQMDYSAYEFDGTTYYARS